MEALRQGLKSPASLVRVIENLFLPERLKMPLLAAFHLTMRCNANCACCNKHNGAVADPRDQCQPSLEQQKEVLRMLRDDVPNIYLMGGEPTVHPQFEELLEECANLDFDSVSVNTNGLIYKTEILEYADVLVFSMHSANPAKNAKMFGVPEEQAERMKRNLAHYACGRNPKKTALVVNCLVSPDSIDDAYGVAYCCKHLGVQFMPAPIIMADKQPDSGLLGNKQYVKFLDFLAGENGLCASSRHYLNTIKHFSPFACAPNTVPAVYPNGDVLVPCENVATPERINLLKAGGLKRAIALGRERYGNFDPSQECADKCHRSCFIETSSANQIAGLAKMIKAAAIKAVL